MKEISITDIPGDRLHGGALRVMERAVKEASALGGYKCWRDFAGRRQ